MKRSIALLLLVSACNAPINANDQGGVVTYGGVRLPKAFTAAEATELMEQHCRRYGKAAEPKGLPPGDADVIVRWQFRCV